MLRIEDSLLEDISWRQDELAILKTTYIQSPESTPRGRTLRRAYLALLYAHYEGFTKFAWEEFLIRAAADTITLAELKNPLIANFTSSQINDLRGCPAAQFVETTQRYVSNLSAAGPHSYKALQTSNLWPQVFEEGCEALALSASYISTNRLTLKSLVSRRNDIAHGKNVPVSDADLFVLEEAVWKVILALADDVAKGVERKCYLRPPA